MLNICAYIFLYIVHTLFPHSLHVMYFNTLFVHCLYTLYMLCILIHCLYIVYTLFADSSHVTFFHTLFVHCSYIICTPLTYCIRAFFTQVHYTAEVFLSDLLNSGCGKAGSHSAELRGKLVAKWIQMSNKDKVHDGDVSSSSGSSSAFEYITIYQILPLKQLF